MYMFEFSKLETNFHDIADDQCEKKILKMIILREESCMHVCIITSKQSMAKLLLVSWGNLSHERRSNFGRWREPCCWNAPNAAQTSLNATKKLFCSWRYGAPEKVEKERN